MLRQLKEIIDMRRKSPNCEVKSCGVDTMRSIADKIQDPSRRKNLVDGIEQGSLKPVFGSRLDKVFRELVKGDGTVVLGNAGETDEVVTVDVKRVIRWPTSLHGKSGMKVVEFPIDRLDPDGHNPFDPLTEAVPWQMGTKDVKVQAIKQDAIYRIGESSGQLSEGEILEVDEATATFLVLKRWADPAE